MILLAFPSLFEPLSAVSAMSKAPLLLRFALLAIFCLMVSPLRARTDSPVLGLWETEDKDAIVQLYACEGEEVCGRFYWLKDDSAENPSLDDRNKDPVLRKRPLCGLTFLGGFQDEGVGRYEGGWIYSARHGAMFSANLKLISADKLELRGFFLIPFLGGGQVWARAAADAPQCPLLAPLSAK